MKILNKKYFQLLEVMIALAIVSLCAIPLIYPHIFMSRQQQILKRELGYDHIANLIYVDLLEQLYINKIGWDVIVNKTPIAISDVQFANAGLPGSGTTIISSESKGDGKVCLLTTVIAIQPPAPEKPIEYTFKSYLKRAQGDKKASPAEEVNEKKPKVTNPDAEGDENENSP